MVIHTQRRDRRHTKQRSRGSPMRHRAGFLIAVGPHQFRKSAGILYESVVLRPGAPHFLFPRSFQRIDIQLLNTMRQLRP